jgi:hypothetical protein
MPIAARAPTTEVILVLLRPVRTLEPVVVTNCEGSMQLKGYKRDGKRLWR